MNNTALPPAASASAVPATTPPPAPAEHIPFEATAPKVLVQGDSGTGKTYSLGKLVDWAAAQTPPKTVAVLFTENGLETLLGYWRTPPGGGAPRPIPPNLAWHQVAEASLDLGALTSAIKLVGDLSYESLTKVVDGERGRRNPAHKILTSLADFPDDRTGRRLGNIGKWGNDMILGIDSLTELADAYIKTNIGTKPVMAQNEYQVAQINLLNLIRYLCGPSQQFGLVMTAHIQKQVNEVTGAVNLMTKAIGRAISDDIPKHFSDVLYCYAEGTAWYWDTAASNVVRKTRYLPINNKIPQDLSRIWSEWTKRTEGV